MESRPRFNLQQYRNYTRSYKYLIRIVMYVSILVLVLVFLKYKLQVKEQPVETDGIEVLLED